MKTRIAIPVDEIFSGLIVNKEEVCKKYDVRIFELDEDKCFELYLSNKADVILISPLTYGLNIGKSDSMIIPASALSLIGYTEIASIIFKKELKTFETIATQFPESYLFSISKLLLAERYDMLPKTLIVQGTESKLLENADSAFIRGKSKENFNSLDIGEEWYDTFEMPLPLAFWICKSEEYPEDIINILKELSNFDKTKEINIFEETGKYSELPVRQGIISCEFSKEFEEALAQVFHFLYYHQLIGDIPEIKILGRDYTTAVSG